MTNAVLIEKYVLQVKKVFCCYLTPEKCKFSQNDYYSPAAFRAIAKFIHLLKPLISVIYFYKTFDFGVSS